MSAIAPDVAPWYERYRATIFWRPVTARAMRIAFSLASAPPRVKKDLAMSPGSRRARVSPRRARTSVAMNGET